MRPASCWSGDTIVPSTPSPNLIIKRVYRKPTETHQSFIKRATSEYCITSVLKHVNIIGAVDLTMQDYHFCIVMDLVNMGDPLSIAKNQISLSDLYSQLVSAVGYIHQLGIAHRNIHPDSIYIFPNNILKLSGFSLAHVFCPPLQTKLEQSYGRAGKASYQPPEVLGWWDHGPPQPYWASLVDIWSIGMVCVQHAIGQLPWSIACAYHDPQYKRFLAHDLSLPSLPFLDRILDPNPSSRINIQQLSNSL